MILVTYVIVEIAHDKIIIILHKTVRLCKKHAFIAKIFKTIDLS